MYMDLRTPAAPADYLVSGVVDYLAALPLAEFLAVVAAARPPADPDDDGPAVAVLDGQDAA